jgi:hypothetical protein
VRPASLAVHVLPSRGQRLLRQARTPGTRNGPAQGLVRCASCARIQVTLDSLPEPYEDVLEWKYVQVVGRRDCDWVGRGPKAAEQTPYEFPIALVRVGHHGPSTTAAPIPLACSAMRSGCQEGVGTGACHHSPTAQVCVVKGTLRIGFGRQVARATSSASPPASSSSCEPASGTAGLGRQVRDDRHGQRGVDHDGALTSFSTLEAGGRARTSQDGHAEQQRTATAKTRRRYDSVGGSRRLGTIVDASQQPPLSTRR